MPCMLNPDTGRALYTSGHRETQDLRVEHQQQMSSVSSARTVARETSKPLVLIKSFKTGSTTLATYITQVRRFSFGTRAFLACAPCFCLRHSVLHVEAYRGSVQSDNMGDKLIHAGRYTSAKNFSLIFQEKLQIDVQFSYDSSVSRKPSRSVLGPVMLYNLLTLHLEHLSFYAAVSLISVPSLF